MKLWKSLRKGIRSDFDWSKWTIGEWRIVPPPVEKCKGLNCSGRIIDAISHVPCEVLALVEVDGKIIKDSDKWTCEKMRIIQAWEWTREDSVALSIFSAEMVICNFESLYPEDDRPRKALEAAKRYLENPCEKNRIAADVAAEFAALPAVRPSLPAVRLSLSYARPSLPAVRPSLSSARSAVFARSALSAAWSAVSSESAALSTWAAAWSAEHAYMAVKSSIRSACAVMDSAALNIIEEWIIKRLETMKEIIRGEKDATIK